MTPTSSLAAPVRGAIPAVLAGLLAANLAGCTTPPRSTAPATAATAETCHPVTRDDVEALFERWNRSLQTGDPWQVAANYAGDSLLLPTLSRQARRTAEEKADYFRHFLADGPSGRVELRHVDLGCNVADDSGLYTFTFARTGARVAARFTFTYRWDGTRWLITSHHSSLLPPD